MRSAARRTERLAGWGTLLIMLLVRQSAAVTSVPLADRESTTELSAGAPRRSDFDAARSAPFQGSISLAQAVFAVPDPIGAGARPAEPAEQGMEFGRLLQEISIEPGPIRWDGSLAVEYRRQSTAGQSASGTWLNTGNLRTATYIGQPWLAQVRAALGFVVTSTSSADAGAGNGSSRGLTGEFGLSLAPMSRFPFELAYSMGDSRTSGEATSADFRTERLTLRQSYRTLEGTQYNARYDRSTLSSNSFGTDSLQVIEGGVSTRFGAHNLEANASQSRNTGGTSAFRSDFTRLNGNHTFSPQANIAVNNIATYNSSRSEFTGATTGFNGTTLTRVMQLSSFASWRPEEGEPFYDEDHPLYFTGSARMFSSTSEAGPSKSDAQTLNMSAGMSYTLAPTTRLTANASVSQSTTGIGQSSLFTFQNAALVHAPEPLRLSPELTYSWTLSGTGSNSTGGPQGARQNVGATGTHSLHREVALGEAGRLTLSASQSLSAAQGTGGGTVSVVHNVASTWSAAANGMTQTYVSLTASDSRTFGASQSDFQIINLQATRQQPLSTVSSWSGNFTVQYSRANTGAIAAFDTAAPLPASGQSTVITGGNLTYQHNRVMNVPRLRFVGFINVNQAQFTSRERGDINAPRDNLNNVFEARLEYTVGKLDTRLTLRSASAGGRRSSLLFWRATRQF